MIFFVSKCWRWSLPVITLAIFTTCELPVDWELKPGENGKLVIEAIITNEQKAQEVKLSLSYNDFNEKPVSVSEAVVRFHDGQNVVEFVEDSLEPGTFRSEVPIVLAYFTAYSLEVLYKGQQHMATSYMVPVLPFQPLTFEQIGETDSLRIKEVADIYGLVQQAMYEININWSHITNADSSKAKVFYYTFTTVDAGQIFSPPKEQVIFPRGSIVVEKKYSLNEDFAGFMRALVLETQWQGGVYEDDSGSLPTNFSNGALGFFGICAVKSDTLIAQ